MDIRHMNDNIIANRWKARYAKLSEEIKAKIEKLNESSIKDYQLLSIKRSRIYPTIGDVFMLRPLEGIELYGVVVNTHINSSNGEDLLLVMIFKMGVDTTKIIEEGIDRDDLLIPPEIVGKEYWTRGYFYNIDHCEKVNIVGNYGFYSVGKRKFLDEYGKEIDAEPYLLGTYGVATISGIARQINRELIIAGIR